MECIVVNMKIAFLKTVMLQIVEIHAYGRQELHPA